MRKPVPVIKAAKKLDIEIANFLGMDNTTHPTLLPLNVPSNLQNSYFQDGVLKKRNGYTKFGASLTSTISESFTATTYKDTDNTTANWNTTGGDLRLNGLGYGDGSDGALHISNGETLNLLLNHKYQYSSITIDAGGTLSTTATSGSVMYLLCSGAFICNGSILLNNKIAAGQTSNSTTIDGTVYTSPSVANGGGGGTSPSENPGGAQNSGYGGGGGGGGAVVLLGGVYYIGYGGGGGQGLGGGQTANGYASGAPATTNGAWGNGGSGGGGGAAAANGSGAGGYGGAAGGNNGTNASVDSLAAAGGGGGGGGLAGKAGIHLVVKAKTVTCGSGSVINTAGTNGGNGGNGGNGVSNTGGATGGSGGGGGGGGNAGYIKLYYNETLSNAGTKTQTAGSAGSAGSAGTGTNYNGSAGSAGSAGTAGVATYTQESYYDTTNNVGQSTAYNAGGATTYQVQTSYTLNGGSIKFEYSTSANGTTGWDAWTEDITTLTKQYIRFKVTLTGTSTTTPTVDSITITYAGANLISSHSWTKPGTTEKYLLEVGGTNIYMYESTGGTYQSIKSNLTTGLRTTAVGFSEGTKSYFVITNGTDSVMRFNGKVSTGTVNVTNGDATVVAGTTATMKWKTVSDMNELAAGGKIKLPDGLWYTIDSITSDTALELTAVYAGGTLTNQAYEAYAINSLAGLSTANVGGAELKGKYITTYKNQLMISGITGYESWVQVSAYMSGVTWSYSVDSSGNPTFTNGSGAININTNDGQIVTALVPFGNSVQVHKSDIYRTKKSVYSLTRNVETWTNYLITSQFAAVSQYATVTAPNAVYFVDSGGIVETNGVTFNKIDGEISATTSLFNQTYIQNAIAAYNVQEGNEFLYFAVPISSSVTNNYLLMRDMSKKGWAIHSGLNMGCFAIYSNVYTPELYFGDQLANSQILTWNTGTSDNGQPIEWIVETAEIPLKQYFIKKKFKYLYAFLEPTGAYIVHAYYSLNGAAYVELTETVTVSGAVDVFKRWALPGLNGSSVKFKFYNYEKDQPITLVRAGVVAIEKGLRRV